MKHDKSSDKATPRRQWSKPGSTVVNALSQAEVVETSPGSPVKGDPAAVAGSNIGKTITVKEDNKSTEKPGMFYYKQHLASV